MDFKKRWRLNFLLALLSIRIAVCDDTCGETYTKRFVRQVQASNDAYEKHKTRQEPLEYTIFRLDGKDIPTRDLLCLHDTLCDTVAPKAVTMITMRKRDGDASDCKDTIMTHLISAIQQNINDEHLTSFTIGNTIMTIDYVEEEQMPGFCMQRNVEEKLRMVFCRLNTLIIEYYPKIIYETYKQGIISYINLSAGKAIQKWPKKESWSQKERDFAIDQEFRQNFQALHNGMKDVFAGLFENDELRCKMSECSSKLRSVYEQVLSFEHLIGFKYFTENKNEFYKSSSHLIYDVLSPMLRYNLKFVFKAGYDAINKANIRLEFKNFFKIACHAQMRYTAPVTGEKSKEETICDPDIVNVCDAYSNFYTLMGLDDLYKNTVKKDSIMLNNLSKRLEIQKTTKIVLNEKLSIENLSLVCEILYAEYDADLNDYQSLYVDIGRNIAKPMLVTGSNPLNTKLFVLNNGSKITVLDNERLKLISKTINAGRESNGNLSPRSQSIQISDMTKIIKHSEESENDTVGTGKLAERMILDSDLADEIKKTISKCLEKRNSRPTGLHKITVPSSTQLTEIYILDHQSSDDESEKTSIIYVDTAVDQSGNGYMMQRGTKAIFCIDDMQPTHLYDLYMQLQYFQATKANEFTKPNIVSAGGKDFVYTKNRLTLSNGGTKWDETTFFNDFRLGWERRSSGLTILTSAIIAKIYADIFIDQVMECTVNCNFGLTKEEIDLLLRKLCLDTDTLESELDNPCVVSRKNTLKYIEISSKFFPGGEHVLYVYVSRRNLRLNPLSDNPFQILNKMLNNKHKTISLEILNCIAYALENDVNTIPMVFNEILESDDFKFFSENDKRSRNKILAFNILQKMGSMFGYTEKWKADYSRRSEKAKQQTAFYLEHKDMIKTNIETLLKIILDDEDYSEEQNVMEITSITKLKNLTKDPNTVSTKYGSLHRLDMTKTCSTKNKREVKLEQKLIN